MLRKRDWAALGGLLYAVAMLALIPPDPWMWLALGYGTLILVLASTLLLVVASQDEDASQDRLPPWQRALPWLAAAWLFAVVAVSSAALETRPGIARTYVLLTIGMLWSVALFRAAYARSHGKTRDP